MKTPPELIIGVKRKKWRAADPNRDGADDEFGRVRKQVLKAENFACRYCGFVSHKYQEVHHIDDNHQNNDPQNLITVCPLCHQVFHLGFAAARGAGFIAVIPELSQVEVNRIARAMILAQAIPIERNNKDAKKQLESLYAQFEHRGQSLINRMIHSDDDQPSKNVSSDLANALLECSDQAYAKRGHLLKHLRLVPTPASMNDAQIKYYTGNHIETRKSNLNRYVISTWKKAYDLLKGEEPLRTSQDQSS